MTFLNESEGYLKQLAKHKDSDAVESAVEEMVSQDCKWGPDRDLSPFEWMAILMEEVGELSEASLHTVFGGPESGRMREEAVQVAAVALQIIEQCDRKGFDEFTKK